MDTAGQKCRLSH